MKLCWHLFKVLILVNGGLQMFRATEDSLPQQTARERDRFIKLITLTLCGLHSRREGVIYLFHSCIAIILLKDWQYPGIRGQKGLSSGWRNSFTLQKLRLLTCSLSVTGIRREEGGRSLWKPRIFHVSKPPRDQ